MTINTLKRNEVVQQVKRYDMSGVAPHRREEVRRRIEIVDRFLDGEISRDEACEKLAMSQASFYRLYRAWRTSRRADLVGSSGSKRKPNYPVSDEQKKVIEDAEDALSDSSMTKVVARAFELGKDRGVKMPGRANIRNHASELRRARGLLPAGVTDIVLEFCALNVPVVHPTGGLVAPIMCVLIEVSQAPIVLGLTLSLDGRSPQQAALTLLDAIARADSERDRPIRRLELPENGSESWAVLREALEDAGVVVRSTAIRPRASPLTVVKLLGKRPAGIELLPNFTGRSAAERAVRIKWRGDPIELHDAEDLVGGGFRNAFPGRRPTIVRDADVRGRLSTVLQRVASETT